MTLCNRFLTGVVIAMFTGAAGAVPFTFDARTLAMGGASAATATLQNAAWANPSMLTRQPLEDDFALLIGVGAFVRDDDDLFGDVEDFQDADERRERALDNSDLAGAGAALEDMSNIINGIDGKVVAPEATLLFALGIAFESFSMAVSLRSDIIGGGTVTDLSCDTVNISFPACDPAETFSEDFNILNVESVLATEIGVSFARDFEVFERRLSVGVKPKVIDLTAFSFRESILTISTDGEDIIDDDNEKSLGELGSIDLGLAIDVTDTVLVGLNIRNLVEDEFDLSGQTFKIETEWEIGIAYHNSFMTLAMDYDLTNNRPLLANPAFRVLDRQDINLGAEFRAGKYAMIRVGAAKNLADGIPSGAEEVRYTAGVGFWLGFNLDVGVIVNDNTVGAVVQTGFSF